MLLAMWVLPCVAHAGTFTYTFTGWSSDPPGAKWTVQFHGTDSNDVAFADGYVEKKDSNGNWVFDGSCWSNYRGFANGDASNSTASGIYQGANNSGTVVHCRLVVKNHWSGAIFLMAYVDIFANKEFPVDATGKPTDPSGNPLPPFACSMTSARTSGGGGVVHVTSIVLGNSNDGAAHTDIRVTLAGEDAVSGLVALPTPLPERNAETGTWDIPVNVRDSGNPAVTFTIILTPLVQSAADSVQAKSLDASWPAYIDPPPATEPASQPGDTTDQSSTRPAGTNPYDMAGNKVGGSGYGFSQGGTTNPAAPPPYPLPATTQPNAGTASNGVPSTAPSSPPANYRPQGPTSATGVPLTGGGGIVGGTVVVNGPTTQTNSSPSETGVNYGEYGTGGSWDRIRQKILAWLQVPPSMPTNETYKLTIPMPWFDGVQNYDLDFNGPYMRSFRVALRAFIAIFVIIAFVHQVIKDIRAY
jgi:hypothetical protein